MKIHRGYEISYDCPQPTPMILTLSVHPSRFADLLMPDCVRLDPPVPANTYHDSFGNFCHVIRAPAGRLTISTDFLVQDNVGDCATETITTTFSIQPEQMVAIGVPFDAPELPDQAALDKDLVHLGSPLCLLLRLRFPSKRIPRPNAVHPVFRFVQCSI